jgi:ankyrin repeat protein
MDDAGVVGLVETFEYSVDAGIAVATREPRLIRERTSLGETALHLLVLGESHDAIRSILALGAEVDAICGAGESPLSLAASLGRVEVVRILLDAGALIETEGQLEPTLHKGVRSGKVEIVRVLLDAGANVNQLADFAEAPLHIASEEGFSDVVELLLSRGADATLKSTFGGTAIDMARAAGNEACIALLIAKH